MRARGIFFVVLVAGALLSGCSSSAASPGGYDYQYQGAGPTMAPAAASDYYEGGAPIAMPPAAASAAGNVPNGASSASGAPAPDSGVTQPEDKIIKTGSISVQVGDLDASIAQATDQIHALGGWLAGSDRTVTSASELASVTYRLPVNEFENALAVMRKLGTKVLSEHTDSTAVGGQIVDLQARIDNLKASEKAIQAIMSKANTIGDVLTVQQRLADVQGQIEELSAQLASLTDQSAYSTLTVVFEVPVQPTPSPSPSPSPSPKASATPIPWSAGDQAGQAAGTLGEVGKSAATVLIWLAILILPIALALLLMLILMGGAARLLDPIRRRLLPFALTGPAAAGSRLPYPTPPAAGGPTAPPSQDQPKL
jgi:hypothetical protein